MISGGSGHAHIRESQEVCVEWLYNDSLPCSKFLYKTRKNPMSLGIQSLGSRLHTTVVHPFPTTSRKAFPVEIISKVSKNCTAAKSLTAVWYSTNSERHLTGTILLHGQPLESMLLTHSIYLDELQRVMDECNFSCEKSSGSAFMSQSHTITGSKPYSGT